MNTRDLEYFVKLVEIKNFSQVAAHFSVTQPTITMALKRLEDQFTIQLIQRDQSHGRLTVTLAGEQLYARAQVVIAQLHLAREELGRIRDKKIRLGLPPILGNYYFPKIARALIGQGLMDQIETVESGSDALFQQVRDGQLDIALLGSSGPNTDSELQATQIARTAFAIVVPKDHVLATRETVRFAELEQFAFVMLSAGFSHVRAFDWFAQHNQMHPNVVYRTPDVTMLKNMIKQGVGIGFLTQLAVTPEDDLVTVKIEDPQQPRFVILVVTRKQQVLAPATQQLKDVLLGKNKDDETK